MTPVHSFAIAAGARKDNGVLRRGLPSLALIVSAKKTATMFMPPPRKPWTMMRVEAAEQIY